MIKYNYKVNWQDDQGEQEQQFVNLLDAERLYSDIWRRSIWYGAKLHIPEGRPNIKDLKTGKIIKGN